MGLKKRFYDTINSFCDSGHSAEMWYELHKSYSQKHRKYHNINHLNEMFHYFDKYRDELNHPEEVAYAIFYHDIIYKVLKNNNEEKSAKIATKYLTLLKVNAEIIERVHQLILDTKTHQTLTNDGKFMMDFDLAILGQPEEIYQLYTSQIRKEYNVFPDILYNNGRKKVLQHFIDKEAIFSTVFFYNEFEKQAKYNLTLELNSL